MTKMKLSHQSTFLDLSTPKPTRSADFLAQMDQVVPWEALVAVLAPHFPQAPTGRPRLDLLLMLRCLCLAQWYNLSDPALEEAITDRRSFQRFLQFDPFAQTAPDHSSFCLFRNYLIDNGLFEELFQAINAVLREKGLLLTTGTLVDATIIKASSSTKNKLGKRDPEMSSTKKNNNYYFGMKIHIGVDPTHALVHTVLSTTAKVHDSVKTQELAHGKELTLCGDKAYPSRELEAVCEECEIGYEVLRPERGTEQEKAAIREANRIKSKVRSRVEWPFRIVKDLWGQRKTRFCGLRKNTAWLTFGFGLANLYQVRRELLAQG